MSTTVPLRLFLVRVRPETRLPYAYRRALSTSASRPSTAPAQRPSPRSRTGALPRRTHRCGSLEPSHHGAHVVLAGWLLPERRITHSWSFFRLRDSSGTVQLVCSFKDVNQEVLTAMRDLPVESVVLIKGTVALRPERQRRPGEPSGQVDVQVESCTLLNRADPECMPFLPHDTVTIPKEELRARYRHLDLRRPPMTDNLLKRSRAAHVVRTTLHDLDFMEVETPMLLKSTPEGAREFLVPTRVDRDAHAPREPRFWALPQSPQQPKQLLMCSGAVDRYYQIARCFRDEDGRKDRQPEFTQVDLELAFASWTPAVEPTSDVAATRDSTEWRVGGGEVRDVIEAVIRNLWQKVAGVQLPADPFDVMTYHRAMTWYGSDKPDTRFGLEIQDATEVLPSASRQVLNARRQVLDCLVVRRSDRDFHAASQALPTEVGGARRWTYKSETGECGSIHGVVGDCISNSAPSERSSDLGSEHEAAASLVASRLKLKAGDMVWFACRPTVPEGGATPMGRLRLGLAEKARSMGTWTPATKHRFLWVTEFPLFTRADPDKEFLAQGRWSSSHHPFTAPMVEDIETMYDGDVASVRGQHYDLVLDGVEIGGGSVRVHDASMQTYIFSEVLKLSDNDQKSFEHLLRALRGGAPPHAGIALGFDRLMAILCKADTIRDVIAFPKTSMSTDPLFNGPSSIPSGTCQTTLASYGLAKFA